MALKCNFKSREEIPAQQISFCTGRGGDGAPSLARPELHPSLLTPPVASSPAQVRHPQPYRGRACAPRAPQSRRNPINPVNSVSKAGNQNYTVSTPVRGGGSQAPKCGFRQCGRPRAAVPTRGVPMVQFFPALAESTPCRAEARRNPARPPKPWRRRVNQFSAHAGDRGQKRPKVARSGQKWPKVAKSCQRPSLARPTMRRSPGFGIPLILLILSISPARTKTGPFLVRFWSKNRGGAQRTLVNQGFSRGRSSFRSVFPALAGSAAQLSTLDSRPSTFVPRRSSFGLRPSPLDLRLLCPCP